jgi:hypothetical protein
MLLTFRLIDLRPFNHTLRSPSSRKIFERRLKLGTVRTRSGATSFTISSSSSQSTSPVPSALWCFPISLLTSSSLRSLSISVKTIGVIFRTEQNAFRVLDQTGSVKTVQPHQISQKIYTERNVAVDPQGVQISKDDKIVELDGEVCIGPPSFSLSSVIIISRFPTYLLS